MTDRVVSQTTNPPTVRSAPRRLLWLLALLVVLGHWLLLNAIPREVHVGPAMTPRNQKTLVFTTRRIEVPSVQLTQVVQALPVQPKPVLIQKPKNRPSKLAEALPTPTEVIDVVQETPSVITVQPLPAVPLEPSVSPQTAMDNTAERATIDTMKAESPAASDQPPEQAQANLTIPSSVRLTYQMTGLSRGLNYHATGLTTWRQDGSHYEASMVVSAFLIGSRSLSSVGDITVDGLAPKRFADKFRSELAAHFQADKGKITFSANTPDAPWKRGVQDRLSVFFQLASLLAGHPEGFPPGTKIPIYTAGQRDVDTWTFRVANQEDLSLPYGAMKAIKLTRDPRQEFDQRVEVWFSPSLNYWPVRIKITQNSGDYIDQQLSSSGPP